MSPRLDILEPHMTQYGMVKHFTYKLYEALNRQKIPCRLLLAENGNIVLDGRDLPTATIGFCGIPGEGGDFLCDQIGVPHIALLVDTVMDFTYLLDSPFMHIGCDDRSHLRILNEMNFNRSFFLPHAVEKDLSYDPKAAKEFDVVMFASCIDYEAIHADWKEVYPEEIVKSLEQAIELTFSSPSASFVEALRDTIQKNVPQSHGQNLYLNKHFQNLCHDLELYIKGRERISLIRAIKSSEVHIFGANLGEKSWNRYLHGQANVHLHDPVECDEAFAIMNRSKILLNSSIKNKEGAHERIFNALACGALPVTFDNLFMREEFRDNEDLILYSPQHIDELDGRINGFLQNEDRRTEAAASGRAKVMARHTWDNRAASLAALPILSSLKNS